MCNRTSAGVAPSPSTIALHFCTEFVTKRPGGQRRLGELSGSQHSNVPNYRKTSSTHIRSSGLYGNPAAAKKSRQLIR